MRRVGPNQAVGGVCAVGAAPSRAGVQSHSASRFWPLGPVGIIFLSRLSQPERSAFQVVL